MAMLGHDRYRIAVWVSGLLVGAVLPLRAQQIPSPAQQFGHEIGADRKLVDWDGIVRYLRMVGERSDRVNFHEVGKTTQGRPYVMLEISSPANIKNLEHYKQLERLLYFQDAKPGQDPDSVHSAAQRQELLNQQKAVVLVTCNIHSTEIGAAQMSIELAYDLATRDDPVTTKILDNVIFLLVPSQNPDGEDMVTKWYSHYVGTDYEGSAPPWLYHHYVGHDDNRDLYMLTQVESQDAVTVLYQDWFPAVWLDEHQMGSTGPRIFTMPATDPININVDPIIYRWNGILGQAQAAALEHAGKVGIIYNDEYTNFWPGAMAWTGWWHNQVGLLTELASVRIASPTDQRLAQLGETPAGAPEGFGFFGRDRVGDTLPPPRDTQQRTTYPRPWLGGHWTLRDIVDYELLATNALLTAAANDRRELIGQIYDANRATIAQYLAGEPGAERRAGYPALSRRVATEQQATGEGRVFAGSFGAGGTPYAIVVPADQPDPATVTKLLATLAAEGVIVERATAPFAAGGRHYGAGTYVIRLAQVFGRYAKDMLEPQAYPEVSPAPGVPAPPPYDVTAWSLGMQMGVATEFVAAPFRASLETVPGVPLPPGRVVGSGGAYLIDAAYNDGFTAANQLWSGNVQIRRAVEAFIGPGQRTFPAGTWVVQGVSRDRMQQLATALGLTIYAGAAPNVRMVRVARPRIALFQPWGSNMDEGWTRWVLEHYGFTYTTLHPQDMRAAEPDVPDSVVAIPDSLRAMWPPHVAAHAPPKVVRAPLAGRFDVLLFADQPTRSLLEDSRSPSLPPFYREALGEDGLRAAWDFVQGGGTVVALGAATDVFINKWPIPVKDESEGLSAEQLLIPGSIVRLQADPTHPLAWGMPDTTYGYFIRNPFFSVTQGFSSQTVSVPVRFPNADLRASGWVRGERYVDGRAAAVEVDFAGGGRLILLGLRPQHRAQTHATFKLLFNALLRGR
jgi:hypothetical protein